MKFIKFLIISTIFLVFSCINQYNNSKFNQNLDSQNQSSDVQIFDQKKQYVLGTEDIPLFGGLELIEEESSNFDAITGNIVISKYTSNSKAMSVKDFYKNTLPQLGWKLSKDTKNKILFVREKDKLEILVKSINKTLFVRFFILYQTN